MIYNPGTNATEIQGEAVSATPPVSTNVLLFNGTEWAPGAGGGGGGTPATTVTGPDVYSAPAVVGTSLLYARQDHDHGLPAAPAPSLYAPFVPDFFLSTLPASVNWYSVAYGNGVFVAVAAGSTDAAYSTNGGQTWTLATLPASVNWYSVAYGNGVFVAVSYGSTDAAYSTNGGQTWTLATLPANVNWQSVAYGNGVFVAVAYGSTDAAYTLLSLNG